MDLLAQHEAFLRAIFDAPDDDTPRLVYADFLQENGADDRAELIRVQCEFATTAGQTEHCDRVLDLSTRERELLDRLVPAPGEWEDPEPRDYVRGFRPVAGPFVVTAAFLADATAARWRLVTHEPETFGTRNLFVEPRLLVRPEQIELLLALAATQRIAEWNLAGHEIDLDMIPPYVGGDRFDFTPMSGYRIFPAVTKASVNVLAWHRAARRITVLDLRNNELDNDVARAIVKSPYLDNLKQLHLLEGNRFRGKVWQQVIERFGEDVVG